MNAKRIIPCLDVEKGRVVKGVKFVGLRDAGDPVELAKRYEAEGADELVILDISATYEERNIQLEYVRRVTAAISIPLCAAGGVRTLEDFRNLIAAGAAKVGINSAAVRTPDLIDAAAAEFGSPRVVVAMDPKHVQRDGQDVCEVYINGGRQPTGLEAVAWAREVERRGAGEILLTVIDADGMQTGYDIAITRAVSDAVTIPVIASGGAGSMEDMYQALTAGHAAAALGASVFHFGICRVNEVKTYLAQRGVPVRQSGR